MMRKSNKICLKNGKTSVRFLESGDIFDIMAGDIMVNQVRSNVPDGSLNNIYLRLFTDNGIQFVPLLGIHSGSRFSYGAHQARWVGTYNNVGYEVLFTLAEQDAWFWSITLEGENTAADLIYIQDLGLGNVATIQANEAYVSQYIDHLAIHSEKQGFIIGSRQNQPQARGNFPTMMQGSLGATRGFLTDGFQFYGLSYKDTDIPEALSREVFPNEVYQYEFAMAGLQSEKIRLDGNKRTIVFYAKFSYDHPDCLKAEELEKTEEIEHIWVDTRSQSGWSFTEAEPVRLAGDIGDPLHSETLSDEEIQKFYPIRKYEERAEGKLLSFFTPDKEHIVLKSKEILTERPHGHILMSGQTLNTSDDLLATTSFMYGMFNSQIVIGNTSMNKMMSNSRNALNVLKTSGQRIYVKKDKSYHLLTLPSLFEIGFNSVQWFYKTADDLLIVRAFTSAEEPKVKLEIQSASGKKYRFLVTNQILMSDSEYKFGFLMKQSGQILNFLPDRENSLVLDAYPDLAFFMEIDGSSFAVTSEERLLDGGHENTASLAVLETEWTEHLDITIQGSIHGESYKKSKLNLTREKRIYHSFLSRVLNGFELSAQSAANGKIGKMDMIAWWYAYDMLIHYLMPHGLEQYGGAAWGTRDVCQGPFEFFMATQHHDIARSILEKVYAHQYEDDGNWPQWFMFDRYSEIQFEESHGDIVVWPMKALSDYLYATGDYSVLEAPVSYTRRSDYRFTERPVRLYDHLKKEVQYITSHFLYHTHLSCYGNGDWDDTLQPHDASMKNHMASSWTVALTYQVTCRLSSVLRDYDPDFASGLKELSDAIEKDYRRYVLADSVIPGFIYVPEENKKEFIIYPGDKKTGIDYRLLPMTRSIISELFTPEQAREHVEIIDRSLKFPDGVRLMNKPAKYSGGVSVHFKRAEQASNFGREIGLMYVHAHIRYIEAMAKLGETENVWQGLSVINPIGITNVVKNAAVRQSNTYFSSSDGAFRTRYAAQAHFEELHQGKIKVKGGWRIYSSGPGIFMNQLITNVLGIREKNGGIIIDPVLSRNQDGLCFKFTCFGSPAEFHYHIALNGIRKIVINGSEAIFDQLSNRYRAGGMYLSGNMLKEKLNAERNIFDIFLPLK